MKNIYFSFLFVLVTVLGAYAQKTVTINPSGDGGSVVIKITKSGVTSVTTYSKNTPMYVTIGGSNSLIIQGMAGTIQFLYSELTQLNGATPSDIETAAAGISSLFSPSGGGGGGGTATSTSTLQQVTIDSLKSVITQLKTIAAGTQLQTAFGTTAPTTASYTGTQAITTTNALLIIIENIGGAAGQITEGGITFSIPTGQQYIYERVFDQTTNKYTPLPTISVNGTGTTIKVTSYLKQ